MSWEYLGPQDIIVMVPSVVSLPITELETCRSLFGQAFRKRWHSPLLCADVCGDIDCGLMSLPDRLAFDEG